MVKRAVWRVVSCAALAAALLGCTEPAGTIRVALSTDAPVPVTFENLKITVRRTNVTAYLKDYDFSSVTNLPDSLVLSEKDLTQYESRDDPITIEVAGLKGTDTVITRRATLHFSERSVVLRMPLCMACLNKACTGGQTCKLGQCVDPVVDEAGLPEEAAGVALTDPECPDPAPRCRGQCGTHDCGQCPATATVAVTPGGFSIDATEVTRADYASWIGTNPHPAEGGGDQDCALATAFYPDVDCLSGSAVCQDPGCENHPQVCVKWCAAQTYCKWAGRRLCGGVGGKFVEPFDVDTDHEWYLACAGPLSQQFPYGDTYDDLACHTAGTTTVPVGTTATCTGSVPGVFDMSGNVSEWENACSGSDCSGRGGSYGSGQLSACTETFRFERYKPFPNVGFRCCADP